MSTLKISKTILPEETFQTTQQWFEAIGVKPSFRKGGSTLMEEVEMNEWIRENKRQFEEDAETWRKDHNIVSHKLKTYIDEKNSIR